MKFRPKYRDVNAIQWTGENIDEIQDLVAHSADATGTVCDVGDGYLAVGRGVLRLRDWLVRGVDERLIYLRSEVFEGMFEPVGSEHRLDPDGDVSMPPVFRHCVTCGHWCNSCGACRECRPTSARVETRLRKLLSRVFDR